MSRPSTTMPGPARNAAMIWRCRATRWTRTPGTAETAETEAVTSAPRIGASTLMPSSMVCGAAGSVASCRSASTAIFVTVSASAGSTSACSTARVTARYIAPVSRYRAPSAMANRRDTVDLPDPDGPSTATTTPAALTVTLPYHRACLIPFRERRGTVPPPSCPAPLGERIAAGQRLPCRGDPAPNRLDPAARADVPAVLVGPDDLVRRRPGDAARITAA